MKRFQAGCVRCGFEVDEWETEDQRRVARLRARQHAKDSGHAVEWKASESGTFDGAA